MLDEDEMTLGDETVKCAWCGENKIPIKQKNNARGYGFYGCCPKCGKETVVEEVDLTEH